MKILRYSAFSLLTLSLILLLLGCPPPTSSGGHSKKGVEVSFNVEITENTTDETDGRWALQDPNFPDTTAVTLPAVDHYTIEFSNYSGSAASPLNPGILTLSGVVGSTTGIITMESGWWDIEIIAYADAAGTEVIGYRLYNDFIGVGANQALSCFPTFGNHASSLGSGILNVTVDWTGLDILVQDEGDHLIYKLVHLDGTDYTESSSFYMDTVDYTTGISNAVFISNPTVPSGNYLFTIYILDSSNKPIGTPGTCSLRVYDGATSNYILYADGTDSRPVIQDPGWIFADTDFDPSSVFFVSGGIEVTWDTTNNFFEDGYILDRDIDSDGTWDDIAYYTTSDPSISSFIDGEVHAGISYTYRVSAYSAIYGTSGSASSPATILGFTAFVVPTSGSDSNNRPYADSPFATVQGALDYFYSTVGGKPAFAPGTDSGTIFVQSGTYPAINSTIVLPGNISVQGGWDNSWNFDGSVADIRLNNSVDNQPVVTLSGDNNNLQYLSLTVLNSQANTVGVEVSAGSVTHSINDVIINSGNATSDTIGLRVLSGSATVNIYDSIIQSGNGNNSYAMDINNAFEVNLSRSIITPGTGASNSYGINLYNGSRVNIKDATVVNNGNAGSESYAVRAMTAGSYVYVGGNSVVGSSANSPDSYGIYMGSGTGIGAYRSFINGGNTSSGSQSYGIVLDNAGDVKINSNYIQGGSAAVSCGVQLNNGTNSTQVIFNTIEGGTGTTSSTAVNVTSGTTPNINSNLLLSSSTGLRYGIYLNGATPFGLTNNYTNYLAGDALVYNAAAVTTITAVNGIANFGGNTDFALDIDPATGQAIGNLLPADLVWGANATPAPLSSDLDGGPTRNGPNYTVGPYEVETDFNGYFFSNNTITVTNNGDNSIDSDYSQTSLREAVELVKKSNYYNTVNFDSNYTIPINSELVIDVPITIDGNRNGDSLPDVTLSRNNNTRIMRLTDGGLTAGAINFNINHITFLDTTSNRSGYNGGGGAISLYTNVDSGSDMILNLDNSHFIGNSSLGIGSHGGALSIQTGAAIAPGDLTVEINKCAFYDNRTQQVVATYGGAIAIPGPQTGGVALRVYDSAFVNNYTDSSPGADIFAVAGVNNSISVERSTFFSNLPGAYPQIYYDGGIAGATFSDSIFWRITPTGNQSITNNVGGAMASTVVDNCLVDSKDPDIINNRSYILDPSFVDPDYPIGNDGIPGNGNDGLRLRQNSPGISAAYLTTFETDIQGFSRYSHSNLGAYENTSVGSVPFAVSAGNVTGPFHPRTLFKAVKAVGTTLYAGTTDGQLYIFDVSSPANPVQIGMTDFGDGMSVLDIEYDPSGYLYIVKSNRIQIVDMGGNWINTLFDFATYQSVFNDSGYLYASLGGNGIAVYDISNGSGFASPTDPALLPAFTGGYDDAGSFSAYDIWVENDYIFVADRDNSQRVRLDVMGDVMNPGGYSNLYLPDGYSYNHVEGGPSGAFLVASNYLVSVSKSAFGAPVSNRLPTGFFRDIKIDGSWGYILDTLDGLNVLDVSGGTITSSRLVPTRAPADRIDIESATNRAYLAESQAGIEIVDISTPSLADTIGSPIYGSDTALDIVAFNGAVFIANGSAGLQVYDAGSGDQIENILYYVTNPSMPDFAKRVGHYYHEPTDTHYLVVATQKTPGAHIYLYTVDNATNALTQRSIWDTSAPAGSLVDMAVSGPNVIVANGNDQIRKWNINTGANSLVTSITRDLGVNVTAVALSGDTIYAAVNDPGDDLYSLDYSSLGTLNTTNTGMAITIKDLTVQGSTLVAVNNNGEFSLVDVRNPAVLGFPVYQTFGGANYTDSFIREDHLLLLDANNGVQLWDISNEATPIYQWNLTSFSAYSPRQVDVDENGTFYIASGTDGYLIFDRN